MSSRNRIVTYVPKATLAAAAAGGASPRSATAAPRPADARPPTPAELAELVAALQLLEQAQGRPGVMATAQDELASNLQTFLTTVMAPAEGRFRDGPNATMEAQFDAHDILGWAGSFFTWWRRLAPFAWTEPGPPSPLPDRARIAVFADWGTGLYGAPVCAASIAARGGYDVVLHLGDVYYSGTSGEIEDRFLDLWPAVPGATNRGLNGNHEMYTGGRAYIDAVRGRFGQAASCFALENARWILACLDTAYDDHDLHGEQAAWVTALAAAAPAKRLVLFSHHQPFSLLDKQGPKLVAKLAALFEARRIAAWYWGHEHHCVLYAPHPRYGLRGRCIGHGGFPYFRDTKVLGAAAPARAEWKPLASRNLVPAARILDGENPFVEEAPGEYGPNGYVTLEIDGDTLVEIVHLPDGTEVWNRPLDALDSE
jgi:hypothetical protein